MGGEPLFEVVEGGLLTTVQDGGRPETTRLGIPVSGAADPWGLAVANLLVGNEPGAAALELTVVGPALRALRPATIAIAGADLGGRGGGRRLAPGRSHRLAAGDLVEFPGLASSDPAPGGWRAYLAVPGGIETEVLLGSRSTCLAGGFGGLAGRALGAGDVVEAGPATATAERVWPAADGLVRGRSAAPGDPVLRVLAGPDPGLAALLGRAWRVAPSSDRVGTRLDGDPLPDGIGGETTTFGVPWGAIQAPPDGRPIILGPDHQTTGGYRVVGVVIRADLDVLGQLGPGASVGFEETSPDAAIAALRGRRQALEDGAAALRDDERWTALADAAGG
jgi:antagonist of KipI